MKRKISRNIIASLLSQIISLLYGLVIPRIVLGIFGSEVNGLVASLGQFLNYITLLEGGVYGVIMASLYKPLAKNDIAKVSGIIKASNLFFRKIALIFLGYSFGVAVVYPLVIKSNFSWIYVFSLAVIIGTTLFIQYFFSLSPRLLLTADQKGYIVFYTQIVLTIVNFFATVVVIKLFPEIHILKLVTACAYVIQPVVYGIYINKAYALDKSAVVDQEALRQRWDGFGQNLAFFIHTNTDIVVLTIFGTLFDVSVYSVYFMLACALKNLVVSISSAIVPSLGSILTSGSFEEKNEAFDLYEFGINTITTVAFTCGIILVTPFVCVYTRGITDAKYYQPFFGAILMFAEEIYCLRDPYVSAAYASGRFRQTSKYAYAEATINIIISIVLVIRFGLLGVAIGTCVSMLYRLLMHVLYLKKDILCRPISKWCISFAISIFNTLFCVGVFLLLNVNMPKTYWEWMLMAIIVGIGVSIVMLLEVLVFYKRQFKLVLSKVLRRKII